jgi:D-amino-acid dehydrogenase
VKGVTVTVPAAPWPQAVTMSVMDHSRFYGLMRIGDRLRVSGSAEVTGYDTAPAAVRCEALVRNVLEVFPGFSACLAAAKPVRWAGLRPTTPDGSPVLGATPLANLFVNAGHGPQGWSTSCGSARIVADVVAGQEPAIGLKGLTLDRFARKAA